jgi:hypothetical protein
MSLDVPAVARALTPDEIRARVEGEYPNSRVLLDHRLPDVVDVAGDSHELRLVSSAPRPHRLTEPPWDREAVNEVRRRLGRSPEGGNKTGAQKGRVLFLLLDGAPVAFLSYHVPEAGDIEILGADSLLSDGGHHHIEILLTASRKVAILFGADRDHLLWSTDRSNFEQIARRHGFDTVAKPLRGHRAAAFQLEARFDVPSDG